MPVGDRLSPIERTWSADRTAGGLPQPRDTLDRVIILGATPIGNLGDASGRLREALTTAPVIAAEDTRTARQLIRALGLEAQPQLVASTSTTRRRPRPPSSSALAPRTCSCSPTPGCRP